MLSGVRERYRTCRMPPLSCYIWVVGGGDLAGQFADAGHLGELQISVAPATLGSGRPLLPRVLGVDRLRLQSVRQNGQFAELVYAVNRP